jgi:tight adherence protein C
VSATVLLAALLVATGAAGLAAVVGRPAARIDPRLRPYTVVTHVALGVAADGAARPAAGATLPKLFGPPLVAALRASQRLVRRSDDARLERRLYQAGLAGVSVDEHRSRMIVTGAAWGAALGAGGLLLRSPFLGVIFVGVGAVAGSARVRATVDRRIDERRDQLRRELYTVNHMLALHLRTGAGPVQAVQRVVERGTGAVVAELGHALAWIRAGLREPDAFRRAAQLTPEPSAARTYLLFAAGAERGADLAGALLALSDDLRDARREELRQAAVKRRAAMLLPTIGILAPIMLLFIAAPLPSIVFGMR